MAGAESRLLSAYMKAAKANIIIEAILKFCLGQRFLFF
jgi:hypothetical protein